MTWGLVAVAGATLVGGVISSSANSKATAAATSAAADANVLSAQYAADAQKYSTDVAAASQDKAIAAATDAQRENNALARQVRDENIAILDPYKKQGQTAGRNIYALLGLDPDNGEAETAFKKYLGSSGYQFQLNEGNKNVVANAAATGSRNSGATLKALQDRGQNVASGYFANYLNTLLGQQSQGFNAATAQTGIGTNFSSQVANQNNAQAATVGNAASNYANAATTASNNTANTLISGANNLATVKGNAALAGAANTNNFINNLTGTAGYIYGMKG